MWLRKQIRKDIESRFKSEIGNHVVFRDLDSECSRKSLLIGHVFDFCFFIFLVCIFGLFIWVLNCF